MTSPTHVLIKTAKLKKANQRGALLRLFHKKTPHGQI